MIGASIMLAAVAVLQPMSGLNVSELLVDIDAVLVPRHREAPSALAIGLCAHLLFGALFGLLYACCQQRAPVTGIIGVGIFYGVMLWAVGGVAINVVASEYLGQFRSWPWLVATVVYGLTLAASSAWVTWNRSAAAELLD